MKSVVSVMGALLAILVPASAAPFEPALRPLRDSLALIADEVF